MNEVILPDFELLFDDNAVGRQLDRVRLVASACLMISTVLFGAFPLSLRLKYSEEWILRVFRRPTQTSSWSVITTAMICACSGVLIALVFVCLIPAFAAMVPEKEKRGPGLDMSMGLMVTLVFQEFVFLRFGNRDSDYINQCHVYIVQFIRCELNVWKTLPVEPRRPSEEEQDEQELAAELLRMTELRNTAVPLDLSRVNAILTVDTPDYAPGRSRYGGYFARKQFYLRKRYPLMNYTVYFGATLLTLHSFADGFCMALQPSIAETWYVFGNLLIHRVLFAVTTTTELMSSNFRSRQIAIVLFILSLMPSLGSFFGTFVARRAKNPTHLALMMGFSAGSLLYVIFFELFRSDKHQHMIGPAQCLSTFTGFLLSTFAYIWTKGIMNA